MRRMRPDSIWPDAKASSSGAELVHRWEALLYRAPRLRPWLDQMLGQKRTRLSDQRVAEDQQPRRR